jgi:hypothetical protein
MNRASAFALPLALLCSTLLLPACQARSAPQSDAVAAVPAPAVTAQGGEAGDKPQSLRKVARKATVSLEVDAVAAAHTRAIAIAEERGGHVLTASRYDARGDGSDHATSSLTLRVPGDKLTSALTELRRLATGAVSEQIGSDDVTDEFVDTESRLRNHKGLEEQLLALLKTAGSVESALKVHQELAAVRGEIERLEGRRQFLERETSWATITLSLSEKPVAKVSEGFLDASFGRAKHDALAVGEGIIVGVIRLAGVFLPVLVLLFAPAALFIWLLLRWRARRLAQRAA